MILGDAIKLRDSAALVVALEEFTTANGVDALIDVCVNLPEPDAEFVRPHIKIEAPIERQFYEKPIVLKRKEGRLSFVLPAKRWREDLGRWEGP